MDCFDEPPANGWDLGFPDVTNPTFQPVSNKFKNTDTSRDDYCPSCFDYPPGLPTGY